MYKILKNGENQFVEFKLSFQKEVIESIVAFANAKGGKIYIGVSDDGKIVGVDINDETLQNYINTIKQNTQPSIVVDINTYNDKSKTILIVDVKEYPLKPIAYKNRYYKRIKNSNHIMSLDEIANEHLKTINSSWDYHIDERHSFSDISQENIDKFIKKIEKFQNKSFDDDPMTILRKYELLKENKLTFGAYLLFTSNNSALTAFQIGRFKSETKIIDNIDINTDILSQVDIAMEFIKKHLMVEYIITGNPQREEKYDYPLEAIREILINMVVHRDYRDSGNSIIKIFDDRIEFFNPGKLYDDITIEKLNTNNYSSRTRNRAIARAFKEAGIIEQYGSGIKRIKSECKLHGVIAPIFEEFVHGFRVVIYKEKLINNDVGVNVGVNVGANDIFQFIQNHQPINVNNIALNYQEITKRTIERWIKQLKEENKIEFRGSKKTGGYYEKQ
jgi:ATP-dependent DNA helicase RecG